MGVAMTQELDWVLQTVTYSLASNTLSYRRDS